MSRQNKKGPKQPDKKDPKQPGTGVLRWKEVRVFVSSTFDDMHAERDYLVKEVFPRLREWCEQRRLRLVDVDLRWGVTEADATNNKRVVDVCLRRIDECRPFFICLLGQRYGWIPRREDVGDETGGAYPHIADVLGAASVTEMEIQHSTVAGKHTQNSFFYLRELSYLADLPSDPAQLRQRTYTDEAEEDAALRKEKLRVLRDQRIPATGRPIRKYSVRWDPGLRTSEIALPPRCPATLPENIETWRRNWRRWAGVRATGTVVNEDAAEGAKATAHNEKLTRGRLTDFAVGDRLLGEVIFEDLQQAIAARFPDHVEAGEQTDLQRELDLQEDLIAAATEGFIGRTADLAALDAYAASDDARLFAVAAAGGIGKTTLLAKWIADRRKRGDAVFCRFIGVGDRSTSVDSLLASLLDELREARRIGVTELIPARIALPGDPPDPPSAYEPIRTPIDVGCDDPRTLRAKLPQLLAGCGEYGRAIIVIDALNQLDSGLGDLDWLPRVMPAGIKMVVSFKTGTAGADELLAQWRASDVHVHECRGFENIEDRKRLVTGYLERHLKELDQTYLEALVLVPGAENPLYLRVVLGELRVFGAFGQLREKLAHDFGTTPVEAFTGVLRRLESDPAHAAVPPATSVPLIFGLLAHAHGGLPEAAIVDLVHIEVKVEESGRRDVAASVALVLRQLRPYLAHREGRVDFFFESFLIAARQRYTRPDAERPMRSGAAWSDALASWCAKWDGLEGASQRYALRWLPAHHLAAGRSTEAAGVMTDFGYHHARAEKLGASNVVEVANDFVELARTELPANQREAVDIWRRFHDENAHLLGRPDVVRPEIQLMQRACAHADASPVTRGVEAWLERHGPERWWFRKLGRPKEVVRNAGLRVLEGHSYGVVSVALRPDGRRAVSGSQDNTVRVWNLETGECLRVLVGHTGSVYSVALCPDGRRAVSGSQDHTLRVWDLDTGEYLRVLEGHAGPVALHADGRRAVSGSQDKTLRVWDLDTGRCLRVLVGHINSVNSVTLCPDGRRVVSVGDESTLRVWDLDTGKCLRVLEGHTSSVCPVALHADGRRAVSVGQDKTLRVWDLDTGECMRVLDGDTQSVTSVALCADGRRAISGSEDKTLRVWDLDTGECLRVLQGHSGRVNSVAVCAAGRRAISGSEDKTLRVWDLDTDTSLRAIEGHSERVNSVAVCADGRRVVSASNDHTLRVWNLETGRCLRVLEGHTSIVNSVAVCANGRRAVSGSHDHTLRVWNLDTGRCLRVLMGHTYPVLSVALCADGRRVVSASNDHTLRVWNLETGKCETGKCLGVLEGHTRPVVSVVLCPDNRRAVSASDDSTLRVWNLDTRECLRVLEGHQSPIFSVALCADNRRAVSGSHDHTLRVWDLDTGECLRVIEDCKGGVLAVSANGHRAASGSWGQTVQVWDLDTGECLRVLEGHTSDVRSVALCADGRRVVWGSEDHMLRAWDLETNESLGMWLGGGNFLALAFGGHIALGGDRIIAGCEDGSVCLFDLMPPGPLSRTTMATWSPTRAPIASAPIASRPSPPRLSPPRLSPPRPA